MPKSNFLFLETKAEFSQPVSMEIEYDQYGWRKTNKNKEKETNKKKEKDSHSSLPVFTPDIKEFSTVLDLLLEDYGIEMVKMLLVQIAKMVALDHHQLLV